MRSIFNRIGVLASFCLISWGGSTSLFGQLISTAEPVPAEVQIMMHFDRMMHTWEVEEAVKRHTKPTEALDPAQDFSGNKEALNSQLNSIQGELAFEASPHVVKFIQHLVREKRPEAEALLGLSHAYRPMIETELERYRLPKQLRFLPAALAAFNTLAISENGNTGLWQLPYHAALRYGLECNEKTDQRRDPILATGAALGYIRDLRQQFGDWQSTLLAYTCGPANLNKARLRTQKNADFETLYPHLPAQSRDFWPAFVAFNYLHQYHRFYRLEPLPVQLPQYGHPFSVEQNLDFASLNKVIGIPTKQLQACNPTSRNACINMENGQATIYLPAEYQSKFLERQSTLLAEASKVKTPVPSEPEVAPASPKPAPKKEIAASPPAPARKKSLIPKNTVSVQYTIQAGDNLGRIAQQYGVKVVQLQDWNDIQGTRINAGDALTIHVAKDKANTLSQGSVANKKDKKPAPKRKTYTVKSGDSLWQISQQFKGVSAEDIMAENKITADIQPGQILRIPNAQ